LNCLPANQWLEADGVEDTMQCQITGQSFQTPSAYKIANANVAVIGGGYWGKNLVRNFHGLGALAAVCDNDEQLLAGLESQYADIETTPSFEEVLRNPAIQAVVIATPAPLHGRMVREALLAGKDVLVEKPLALSESDGEKCVRLAQERQRVLMVGHLLWYHPAILKLKNLIEQGELGRLQYIYSQRLNLGRIRREENILWSFAPHDISVILGLVGEFPERVQAQGGYYLHQQIADVTVTCLTFPSGVGAHVFVSWLHPFKEQRLVVVGDRKMAVFNDVEPQHKLTLYPHSIEWKGNFPIPNHKDAQPVQIESFEPLRAECEHFLNCVRMRGKPRTDGPEALSVLRVLRLCEQGLEREEKRIPSQETASVNSRTSAQNFFAHPTAIVDKEAEIGARTRVWHYSHIMSGARIGKDCVLGQNVFVGANVRIGNNVKIQNNVSVYEGVELKDHVFCGPSMVFTNVINPRSEIERKEEFRPTLVSQGATLGANCVIMCGTTVGSYAFIGAGAVVTRDVPDYALVYGNPARVHGWMCRCGVKLKMASNSDGKMATCKACGKRFVRSGVEAINPVELNEHSIA
jgi:UDP-2-acetamido-3-amino-2,3-dideoxy-glucuronate N-acetyltransferase